jgi:hypothetical protein
MKHITIKKSILSKVVLLASLITAVGIYGNNNNNELAIKEVGAFVHDVERKISDFCNPSNKTPMNNFIIALEKLFYDFKAKIEITITRNNNDVLTNELYNLTDYILYQFNIACTIIKKYNGRPSSEALIFGAEIRRDFNTEKVFTEIIAKLKTLKCKADQAHESCLIKKIDIIIKMIEIKRKEWNAKSDWSLSQGLVTRMNCK